ncbi:Sensory neuron membrane protein 1 [Orchesella cincta]|uniref:Sensory neuron membrane protein 2 n=1 Tax=Orchesella cincta TaxID=48709 RepID=A0A1D2MU19_ORCCI|nr:Sensory neuron membrane protein 1 [Orchesella cincta]
MKAYLVATLLGFLLGLNFIDFASSVGSKTYETNNGFPINFLNDLVNSDVVQRKISSRWRWEVWDVVPGTHAYQLYVFNITNPDEVEKGGKPSLQQVGPYYFKEYRYKFDVSMNLDLSVNFVRNYTYTFDPNDSKGSANDMVNVINVPFVIFSTLAAKYGSDTTKINQVVSALVASGESLVKKNVKVQDFLFEGMDVSKYQKYLNLMGPSTWVTDEFRDGRYGVLKLKNGVHEGSYTVDSGLKSEKGVGKILTYNELPSLTYWNGDKCNAIMGSDGSVFPPHLKTSDKLTMFEVDFCRSIDFEYAEEVQYKSVMGSKYHVGKDVLQDPSINPDNQCFCSKNNSIDACLKEGVLDVSPCQFGSPFVMSYAHFLDASPEYQQGVVGLKPDPKIHETYVTVELVTGAVLAFHKRYQWNIWIKPIAGIDYFSKFKSTIVPILWNDDIFKLDADKEELLMEELARQAGGMGGGAPQPSQSHAHIHIAMLIITALYLFRN